MWLSENSEVTRLITAAQSISQSVTFRFLRIVSALEICQDSYFAEVTGYTYSRVRCLFILRKVPIKSNQHEKLKRQA
jgi:hypothetical protein